jgi:hypothetical protein
MPTMEITRSDLSVAQLRRRGRGRLTPSRRGAFCLLPWCGMGLHRNRDLTSYVPSPASFHLRSMLAGTGSLDRLEIEILLTTGYVIPAIVLDPVATC